MSDHVRSGMLQHVPCLICGADAVDVVYESRYEAEKAVDLVNKFRASGDDLLIDRLVRCQFCLFHYVSPRLRSDLIMSGYSQGEDWTYVSQLEARERTFSKSLDRIERAVDGKGRLLDIGTAAGAFVAVARDRGWDAEGCEPNHWLGSWGARHYGIRILQGSVFDQNYEEGSFDVITLWDVIEHATDPDALVARCRALLKPGGLLVVNYPDIGSWIARLLKRRWLFLTSVHLYYFDRRTMRMLLEKNGLSVETARPHVQWLELDYIVRRGSRSAARIMSALRTTARAAGMSRAHVPYWFGQTCVLARKHLSLLMFFGAECPCA